MCDQSVAPVPGRGDAHPPFERSARSLLLTVLGELVAPEGEPVWTASLLYVLTGLGVSEPTARQALARASDSGWLAAERFGREVRWALTPTVTELINDITRRVVALNTVSTTTQRWDGTGIILHISLPAEKRSVRRPLYSALGWAGFGNPAPGLWISPHVDRLDETRAVIDELGLRELTSVFVGRLADVGLTEMELLARAWDLETIAARYAALLHAYADMRPEPGDEQLFSYLSLVDDWRTFPAIDPQLPPNLPPDWVGHRAAAVYVAHRANWQPGARAQWAHIVRLTASHG